MPHCLRLDRPPEWIFRDGGRTGLLRNQRAAPCLRRIETLGAVGSVEDHPVTNPQWTRLKRARWRSTPANRQPAWVLTKKRKACRPSFSNLIVYAFSRQRLLVPGRLPHRHRNRCTAQDRYCTGYHPPKSRLSGTQPRKNHRKCMHQKFYKPYFPPPIETDSITTNPIGQGLPKIYNCGGIPLRLRWRLSPALFPPCPDWAELPLPPQGWPRLHGFPPIISTSVAGSTT